VERATSLAGSAWKELRQPLRQLVPHAARGQARLAQRYPRCGSRTEHRPLCSSEAVPSARVCSASLVPLGSDGTQVRFLRTVNRPVGLYLRHQVGVRGVHPLRLRAPEMLYDSAWLSWPRWRRRWEEVGRPPSPVAICSLRRSQNCLSRSINSSPRWLSVHYVQLRRCEHYSCHQTPNTRSRFLLQQSHLVGRQQAAGTARHFLHQCQSVRPLSVRPRYQVLLRILRSCSY